jgi:hypothetical protein
VEGKLIMAEEHSTCGAELPDYFGTRVCHLLPDHGGDWHDDGARQWSTRDGSIRPVDETKTKQ